MKLSAKKFLGTGLALGLTAAGLFAQSAAQFGNLPLWFEAGMPAKFTAHAGGSEFSLSPAGAEFTLTKKTGETAACRLRFVGANPAAGISGDQKLSGTVNYLLGSDAGQWRAHVPTFAQVRVENIYPGVNLVYYGNRQKLEYDFNLAAGADPAAIALRFDGAEKVSVDAQGGLVISLGSGEVVQHPPVAYQTVHGARQEIAASYKMLDAHTAAFALGDYDRSEPLVIDPVLTYSSYFGGNAGDTGWAIAVNPVDGSIYVAGQTFSTKNTNSPSQTFSTPGAFQTTYAGGKVTGDAFVARFTNDVAGNLHLLYATYLGGTGNDGASSLAVDPAGNAYLAGYTDSADFPTANALYPHISGVLNKYLKTYPEDAFVAELNPAGDGLVYATYLGGESMDAAFGIALDDGGDAFVTGYTYSKNFPVTPGAFQSHQMCSNTFYINANAFVAEISPGGSNLNYATYLGGTNFDQGLAVAYNSGTLFVAGYTLSTNFPAVHYIPKLTLFQTNYYTVKINGVEVPTNAVNTNIFVGNLLNGTAGAVKTKNRTLPASDAFVTAFTVASPTNFSLLYSTFLGGTNDDRANAIAADAAGSAYVAGYTSSTNFPDTVPYTAFSFVNTNMFGRYTAATNGFLTKIAWDGTNAGIAYSAMFGGRGADVANGVALDPAGDAYVVGSATSTNFPVTTNNIGGGLSATNHYVKKRFKNDVVVIAFNPDASALLFSTYIGGVDNDYGNAIAVDPLGYSAYITGSTYSTNFPAVNALQSHLNGKSNDMFVAVISLTNAPPVPALLIAPQIPAPSVQNKIAGSPSPDKPGIRLTWQMFPANYDVESSTDLAGWQPAPAVPAYSNGWYHVTLPMTNSAGFFRLHKR